MIVCAQFVVPGTCLVLTFGLVDIMGSMNKSLQLSTGLVHNFYIATGKQIKSEPNKKSSIQ